MATIISKAHFNAEEACKILKKAINGLGLYKKTFFFLSKYWFIYAAGTDEKKVIDVIASHNNEQRQLIKTQYTKIYAQVSVTFIK